MIELLFSPFPFFNVLLNYQTLIFPIWMFARLYKYLFQVNVYIFIYFNVLLECIYWCFYSKCFLLKCF